MRIIDRQIDWLIRYLNGHTIVCMTFPISFAVSVATESAPSTTTLCSSISAPSLFVAKNVTSNLVSGSIIKRYNIYQIVRFYLSVKKGGTPYLATCLQICDATSHSESIGLVINESFTPNTHKASAILTDRHCSATFFLSLLYK